MEKSYVFVVGLPKTGTTSIEKALKKLGYNVCSWRYLSRNGLLPKSLSPGDTEYLYNLIGKNKLIRKKFDAVQDTPWPYLWEELYRRFPHAKFILTLRSSPEKWVESASFSFGEEDEIYRRIYFGAGESGMGRVPGNEEIYKKIYIEHNHAIIEHFQESPDKLLVFNIDEGDDQVKWRKLCSFLGRRVPNKQFPHRKKRA